MDFSDDVEELFPLYLLIDWMQMGHSDFSISRALDNDELKIPAGTATIPSPIINIENVKTFPPMVIGYMSPYPTVVRVATSHHKLENIDVKTSGCAGFSKK